MIQPDELGPRIHKLRRRQRRTLEDVARACGFTRGFLSKIERGLATPPIATLARIASALGVKPGDLLEGGADQGPVFERASAASPPGQIRTEKGYWFHLFAGARSDKLMQPFFFQARRGEVNPEALIHHGEEFIFVLEGSMRFRVGHRHFSMEAGDSLYFDAEEAHDLEPISEEVRYLAVFVDRP